MSLHYLLTISDNQEMIFRTELLILSILKFSKNKPQPHFSIIVNGDKKELFGNEIPITVGRIKNKCISKYADVFSTPYHWTIHAPSRWFIPPKTETCVFIDADVVACNDLSPIYDLDKNAIHGVTAYRNALDLKDWQKIGLLPDDLKYYFNFGVLLVPSKHCHQIGTLMIKNIKQVLSLFPNHEQFAGQIALAMSLKEAEISKKIMPSNFHWFDIYPETQAKDDILFLHYFINKNAIGNKTETCRATQNKYTKIIAGVARSIYSIMV